MVMDVHLKYFYVRKLIVTLGFSSFALRLTLQIKSFSPLGGLLTYLLSWFYFLVIFSRHFDKE